MKSLHPALRNAPIPLARDITVIKGRMIFTYMNYVSSCSTIGCFFLPENNLCHWWRR